MKTLILEDTLSEKELFFIYRQILDSPNWQISGSSEQLNYPTNKQFLIAPQLVVLDYKGDICNYPLYLYGQTLVYRIIEKLKSKHTAINSKLIRMWFNITYNGKETQHSFHQDDLSIEKQTIVMFMTPIWAPDWKGSFYTDGEKFKFKPGNAIIFDSNKFHTGESPESETHNWLRLTLNMVVSK